MVEILKNIGFEFCLSNDDSPSLRFFSNKLNRFSKQRFSIDFIKKYLLNLRQGFTKRPFLDVGLGCLFNLLTAP